MAYLSLTLLPSLDIMVPKKMKDERLKLMEKLTSRLRLTVKTEVESHLPILRKEKTGV